MGQKHIFEVIWDYSILTFACSSWRFLNIGVVCELYLALDMNLIAFFAMFLCVVQHWNPMLLFHKLGDIEI